jgi:exportin-5
MLIDQDPLIRKRILQLLTVVSSTALDKYPAFMLQVLEHILVTWPTPHSDNRVHTDAVKELQAESLSGLQKLAAEVPDHLLVRSSFPSAVKLHTDVP